MHGIELDRDAKVLDRFFQIPALLPDLVTKAVASQKAPGILGPPLPGSLVGAVSASWLARRRHAPTTTDSTGGILSPTHPSGCRATQHKDHATGPRAVYVQPDRRCQVNHRLPDPPVNTSQRELAPDTVAPLGDFSAKSNFSCSSTVWEIGAAPELTTFSSPPAHWCLALRA